MRTIVTVLICLSFRVANASEPSPKKPPKEDRVRASDVTRILRSGDEVEIKSLIGKYTSIRIRVSSGASSSTSNATGSTTYSISGNYRYRKRTKKKPSRQDFWVIFSTPEKRYYKFKEGKKCTISGIIWAARGGSSGKLYVREKRLYKKIVAEENKKLARFAKEKKAALNPIPTRLADGTITFTHLQVWNFVRMSVADLYGDTTGETGIFPIANQGMNEKIARVVVVKRGRTWSGWCNTLRPKKTRYSTLYVLSRTSFVVLQDDKKLVLDQLQIGE